MSEFQKIAGLVEEGSGEISISSESLDESEYPLPLDSQHSLNDSEAIPNLTPKQRLKDLLFSPWYWLKGLVDTFGLHFVLFLVAIQHITKGLLFGGGHSGWIGVPIYYLFRELRLTPTRMQQLRAVAMTPWSIKPLIGMFSDLFPVFGYYKGPYMVLVTIIGAVACCIIFFFWPLNENFTTCLLFSLFLMCSTTDLLSEAKYAEKLQEHPSHGPSLMSFVWGGIFIMTLISTSLVGVMLNLGDDANSTALPPDGNLSLLVPIPEEPHYSKPYPYLFAFLPILLTLIPLIRNWIGETRYTGDSSLPLPWYKNIISFNSVKLFRQWKLFLLATIMGFNCVVLATLTLLKINSTIFLIIGVTCGAIQLTGFAFLTPPVIAKAQAFFFLNHVCTLSIESGSFYFYTDDATQFPEGPHFSKVFYTTAIGTTSALCNVFGIVVYNLWMKHWTYRRIFIGCNILYMLVNLISIIVFRRWNRVLGIPDEVFVLGTEAIQHVVRAWVWIPGVVMISQICPKDVEATMYALLAGGSNLGYNLAEHFGAVELDLLGIRPNGTANESSQFDNLWIASLIASVFPLITVVMVPYLIPDVRQTDRIEITKEPEELEMSDLHDDESEGSIKKRALNLSQELSVPVGIQARQRNKSADAELVSSDSTSDEL